MARAEVRERHTYTGIVQGVGFRPAVYRAARGLGLTGGVRNERSLVSVEIQGTPEAVSAYAAALLRALPAAARIDRHTSEPVPIVVGETTFDIRESIRNAFTLPPIPPDLALCDDCAGELLEPTNRRYLYPFISCTQCGPRYTIVRDTPFDRVSTSMAAFPLCPACLAEYREPSDRRFHAQATACPSCGPTLRLLGADGRALDGDPLVAAIRVLARGGIVALLGLGGFHLAADPLSDAAMRKLRRDKDRERKPFALMVRDLVAARELVVMRPEDEALLASSASPIVILPALPDAKERYRAVSDTGTLGILLPYTPLHLLLFRHPLEPLGREALVMTSGNLRDEPILTDPAAAVRDLAAIADVFLVHNREVVLRADDSVMRPAVRGHLQIRRSRGLVPGTLTLADAAPEPILALGGDLKSAPALALGSDVYLSPHVGDLDSVPAREAFEGHVRRMLELYRVEPASIRHDAHPGYVSSRWAAALPFGRKQAVQHHHAHVLSVMAEHGLEEALGLAFDGTGWGPDGSIWGGELLRATRTGSIRLGCVAPFPLPGGDAAIRHPARTAYALLRADHPGEAAAVPLAREVRELLDGMLDRGVSVTATSSMGRVFDAAAAVLGLVRVQSYEGEAPIRLEGLAASRVSAGGGEPRVDIPLREAGDLLHLDAASAVAHLARLARGGADPGALALSFHRAVATACRDASSRLREITGVGVIALSGGVFQNGLLLTLLVPMLEETGLAVVCNRAVPPGDGGLALGQAWYLDQGPA